MALSDVMKNLPTEPGVYLFKDSLQKVLYVGKASNLRTRVRSYMVPGGDGRIQIPALIARSEDIEVVITKSPKDALLLENELIKKYKPPFNVRLRDDKQYLSLRLDPREQWPRLTKVRSFSKDGAQYFGPYTSSQNMREALSTLRKIFPLRSCSDPVLRDYQRRGRPCIEYEMKRCVGPCCELVSKERYDQLVAGTKLFLRGNSQELIKRLTDRMQSASFDRRYEEAAQVRDQIGAIETTVQRQQIVSEKFINRDIFGLARVGEEASLQVLQVRDGRMVGAEEYGISGVQIDNGSAMASFIGQYYAGKEPVSIPDEVLSSNEPFESEDISGFLTEKAAHAVKVRYPKRGKLKELTDLSVRNASLALEVRLEKKQSIDDALDEIQKKLGLKNYPHTIECYDISTLNGSLPVGSKVVFKEGNPLKSEYRRYKIRDAKGGDDLACLREVLERRMLRIESDPMPDLLMVDGGRGQVAVVSSVLADASLTQDHIGIAKEQDSESKSPRVKRGGGLKKEKIFIPGRSNPIFLFPSSRGLLLLQRVRDEAHRFAIEYQRDLRSKINLVSILEELPGIGPVKRKKLIGSFGSLKQVRQASLSNLESVSGISEVDAKVVYEFFNRND